MNKLVIEAVKAHLAQLTARSLELQAWINDAEKGATSTAQPRKSRGSKRILSPEARKRIADAQKKRWAAFRKGKVA